MLEFDSNNSTDAFITNSEFTSQSELQQIRANYSNEVKGIAEFTKQLIAGRTEEEMTEEEIERIARQAHSLRHQIGLKYKELTPQQERDCIYARNLKRYGEPLGPTIEYLRVIGKTWLQIIESASRPNPGDINDILREE